MLSPQLTNIYIYPIKSTAGITLPQVEIDKLGLAFDRRFVLCDENGQALTARTEPKLCLVQTRLTDQGMVLSAANMPDLTLNYQGFSKNYKEISLWGDNINSQLCSLAADIWFSTYLHRPCQLVFFGDKSSRIRKQHTANERSIAFADGYPLLLISQASLTELNKRLNKQQLKAVVMSQFRPNIVVDACSAFAEDTWQHIRIGEVEFKVSKPCERCIFTTINPDNGEKDPQQQPLSTLSSYRKTLNGEVLFGQNLIPLNKGVIRQGDTVQVLSLQQPPVFTAAVTPKLDIDNTNSGSASVKIHKKVTITFEKWQKQYQGDNQKTILEHGEAAGLILPYSCSAGMCGRCKAKLISGEVKQSSHDGLTAEERRQGYILCCSSIAESDVVIDHNN